MSEYLNAKQLSEGLLRCFSVSGIYKLAKRRGLPHKRIGDRIVFRSDEVIQWMEKHNATVEEKRI